MTPPIALQLYSLRERANEDFEGTVRLVAEMGYAGVEPAGVPGPMLPSGAGDLFRELGLQVPSAHCRMPVGDDKNAVLDAAAAIDCPVVVSGQGPDDFATIDKIKATLELFNEAGAACREVGLRFGVHNHWWEYVPVEGVYPYQMMIELLDPDILCEIDTYWVQTGGCDVAQVLREMGERSPLLHIKDGPCVAKEPMTAVGSGVMDFPAILASAGDVPQWLIVEQDRTAGDMVADVRSSYEYLVGSGLARGRA